MGSEPVFGLAAGEVGAVDCLFLVGAEWSGKVVYFEKIDAESLEMKKVLKLKENVESVISDKIREFYNL